MVYAALRQAASVASIENKSRFRNLYKIQIGNLGGLIA